MCGLTAFTTNKGLKPADCTIRNAKRQTHNWLKLDVCRFTFCVSGQQPARAGLLVRADHCTDVIVTSRSSVISRIAYLGPSCPKPLSFTPPYGMRSTRLLDVSFTWTLPTSS